MTSIADGSVRIQASSESVPSTPSWFGESNPTRNPTFRQGMW
ncbi:hypothetical protein [Dictyobacter formicarum]|nr:hypothetical protein [Dictyobacter formicarum]